MRTDRGEVSAELATFVVEKRVHGDTVVRVLRGSVTVEDSQHRAVVRVKRGQETQLSANAAPSPPIRYNENRDPDCPIESLFK